MILEVRRSRDQNHAAPNLSWSTNYSAFPPLRQCNDSDPMVSSSQLSIMSSMGCNSLILGGSSYGGLLLSNLLPRVFHVQPLAAVGATVAMTALLAVALLVVGGQGSLRDAVVVPAVLLQVLRLLHRTTRARTHRMLL